MGLNYLLEPMGLSITFVGIMLSIVTLGIVFFGIKTQKNTKKELLKIGGLIASWAIVLFLVHIGCKACKSYTPIFLEYSFLHLSATILAIIIVSIFFVMLPKLWKKFDKKLLVIMGTIAVLSIIQRIIFPFFFNPYLSILHKITVTLPQIFGLFLIIKFSINGK
jgi:cytochrome bd-type quinol oxidase subunit 2